MSLVSFLGNYDIKMSNQILAIRINLYECISLMDCCFVNHCGKQVLVRTIFVPITVFISIVTFNEFS